ncbi:serine/threonine-protein kinase 24-like [Tripterygium wilfordii]|uniref:serine/threonine-protein kinase 24-like n=1 Tax=Tripterygium wilfordii TaxID=458696 RepID=UPI0018F83022|nr:serine/threonine-protein kinase 24-like [Tripterygium wilfordii]
MESDDGRFHCEWERGALIGKGAFGSVFFAHPKLSSSSSRLLPPVFAVKSAEILFSATLENELEVFNHLQSFPHIISCFGRELTVTDNGETVYNLLMEYVSGGSLADHIKKSGRLPVEQIKNYTRQLRLGLAHIHESGYVHCDIKPDNVLLAPSGDDFVAKIADFGLAKRRERKFSHVKGTSSYLAPECVVNGVQDCGSDIWAVGCVVYEMLTEHSVWQHDANETSDDIFYKIAGRRPCIDFGLPWEAKAFLIVCFERTAKYRPTAARLLEHTFLTGLIEDKKEEKHVDENGFGSEEEEEEVENGCEEELDSENQKVAKIGCEVEEDPEELEEAENGCEEQEEDREEEEPENGRFSECSDSLFGSEEEEEIQNGCEELDSGNQKVPEIGCEIEEDPEELEEAENGCEEEEEENPEEEELFGSEEEEEEIENGRFFDFQAECSDSLFGSEEEEEVENGCEEELDNKNQKVAKIGCVVEEDPEELEEAENDCEEEEDPEEEELFGSEEEEEEEIENGRFFDFQAECSDSLFGSEEEEEVENGCEEELHNENQKVVENGCEVEEEDPEEEVGSSYMFEDDWSFIPKEESMMVPCSLSKNDMTLPASKRRKISHLNPITGGDLTFRTLAPTIAAGL